jgi:outer membrane protein assembly factor BamB
MQAPAVAGDGTVFLDGADRLLALDAEGKVQWQDEIYPPADPQPTHLKTGGCGACSTQLHWPDLLDPVCGPKTRS